MLTLMKISVLAFVSPLTLVWEIGNSSLNSPEGYGDIKHHLKDNAVLRRPTHKVSLLLSTVSRTPIHASDPLITWSVLNFASLEGRRQCSLFLCPSARFRFARLLRCNSSSFVS